MRKILFLMALMASVFSLTLISCGGDDSDSGNSLSFDKDYLVGTWTIETINGTSPFNDIYVGKTITFNSDGSMVASWSETAWKLQDGRVITIYNTKTGETAYVYTLLAKNGKTATVEIHGTLSDIDKSVNVVMTKQ